MPAYSFKKRFAGSVRNGRKRQTIRKPRKYPTKPGDTLYLYTALRTKWAKKLREVTCKSVHRIYIFFNKPYIHISPCWNPNPDGKIVLVKGAIISDMYKLNEFARADGFKNWEDMKAFWIAEYGVKKGNRKVILRKFEGELIKW